MSLVGWYFNVFLIGTVGVGYCCIHVVHCIESAAMMIMTFLV